MTKINFSKDLFRKVFLNFNQTNGQTIEDIDGSDMTLKSLEVFIDSKLSNLCLNEELNSSDNGLDSRTGRLGPKTVIFDVCHNVGSLVIESDGLSLSSHSGFSSIKANVCVHRGKWQYEVCLNSKGVMQIGWSTRNCRYSQEKGVGDTNDSYAYDGNRVRKWNVSTSRYGQNWQIGDCITCAIDLEEGTIDFYRNGHHLGTAFNNVRIGKSYAYFPAISLAYQESVVANFGSTPFRYPVDGYQPLELLPISCVTAGALMVDWISNLTAIHSTNDLSITQYLICNKIFSKLSQIVVNKYVIEECFLKTFMKLSCDSIHAILDLMWTLLEEQQIHDFLQSLTRSVVNGFRFSPISMTKSSDNCNENKVLNFEIQKQYLSVMLSLVTDSQTRHHLLKHILFESKFPLILDIKSLEDESLTSALFSHISIETVLNEKDLNNMRDKGVETAVSELESLQDRILSAILFEDDISRSTFVEKLEHFVKETVVSNSRSHLSHQTVPNMCPIVLSMFQRLSYLIRNRYRDAITSIGVTYFVDNINDSNDSTRIGGTASYLHKQNRDQLTRTMKESVSLSPLMKDIYRIVDNLLRVYPSGAHKHLAKLCTIGDNLDEYIKAYELLKERSQTDPIDEQTVGQTLDVLEERIVCYSRQLFLINSIELKDSRKCSIYWLFKLLLNTLEHSSSCGHLFSFIPDYFIDALISLFSSIRFYYTIPSDQHSIASKAEYEVLLQQFSAFIASHFCDQRITIAEIKDNLSQSLASLVSNPETLKALESISFEKRIQLVKCLCKPYENRAWAQSNWTVLRFWKGSGFAYRYSTPPNTTIKLGYPLNKDQNSLNYLSPYPSILYQSLIGEYLKSEPKCAIAFITSLLSQLNWTFSEFIAMLQEIQNSANRPQKVFIDSRQLKICSTCFELTLALLRVLELIICVYPELITLSPSNQLILTQLSQLLCQLLNRVTIIGCFDFVVDLQIMELDSISHFQILASVSGILIALTLKGSQESREQAIRAIISDASFVSESLEFLIGNTYPLNPKSDSNQKRFCLNDFEELNEEEKTTLRQMVSLLTNRYQLLIQNKESFESQDIPDDQICTICYANKKVAVFSCGHQSCRSCIAIHFLRNGEKCFFCKALIERVVFSDSDEILYPKNTN